MNFSHDHAGDVHMYYNVVCMGTGYQMEIYVKPGKGVPRSSECLDLLMPHWISLAGFPKALISDRGLQNRGIFSKDVRKGVYCSSVGLEAPNRLGMVVRDGGVWKKVVAKVFQEREIKEPRWLKSTPSLTARIELEVFRQGNGL